MQNVADVEDDTLLKSVAVCEDFDQAFLAVRGVDGDEAMVEGWSLGVDGDEAELFERGPQCSSDQHGLAVVHFCEEVDVMGEA